MGLDTSLLPMEIQAPHTVHPSPAAPSDPIAQFPATGQPLSDVTLKDMLMSLRASIQTNMVTCIQQCRAEVQEIGEHVHKAENKMSEFTTLFNVRVDYHTSQQEVIAGLQSKLADLEHRSRRNNLKYSGSRSPGNQLPHFV